MDTQGKGSEDRSDQPGDLEQWINDLMAVLPLTDEELLCLVRIIARAALRNRMGSTFADEVFDAWDLT